MGLREISLILLATGAGLAIVGGLGVCCYNLRFFDKNSIFMNQWGGFNLRTGLQCALSSGIFGLIRALVCLVALILLIIGLNKTVVSILFIVSVVLYLGELIPEAVFLSKYQYYIAKSVEQNPDDITYNIAPKAGEITENGEEAKWIATYTAGIEEQKQRYITECSKEPNMNTGICSQTVDNIETQMNDILQTNAVKMGDCWLWNEAGKSWSHVSNPSETGYLLFIPDFWGSKYPENLFGGSEPMTESDCDSFEVAVVDHKGGWSAKTVTNRIVKKCKEMFQTQEEPDASKDGQSDFYAKYARKGARMIQNESPLSVWAVNTIFLGVQTFAFALTIAGVILFCRDGPKVSAEP